ncbi:hypothetical protein [Streptomyces sp. NBC_01180]|uniref:hypothetical protein n=1 Tax=Streptomyces sp. NBC_01180 TaxID=2903763 RepID=UPI0038698AD1|nr:hypothetical protein OG708_23510 [Streptomyces sp. NBC_01180]
MSMRRTLKARRALAAVAVTAGLALTVAGCGGDGGGKDRTSASSPATKETAGDGKAQQSPAPAGDKVLADVKGDDGIGLTVTSAVRDSGGFVTISGKVTNGSGKIWTPTSWAGDESELAGNSASMAGASLVDQTGKKKYLILRDTSGRCLCTKFVGAFQASEERTFYAQFPAPPASTKSVEFQIGDMPPATIDISDGQ